MSKGSSPRPFEVSQQVFASNWDAIFKKGKKDVFQQETQDTNRNLEAATPAQAWREVLGDSESTAERVATSSAE